MAAVRTVRTAPEQAVRSCLRSLGIRFRGNLETLPGKPDLVIADRHLTIFVHGCFWHSHKTCSKGSIPRTNRVFWQAKLSKTRQRDRRKTMMLRSSGWKVATIWECQTRDVEILAMKIRRILERSPESQLLTQTVIHTRREIRRSDPKRMLRSLINR
jgi:DNA mismatch endonuclease (patch repair protein)